MNKTERLQIRIDTKLKEDLKQLAASEGQTISSFIESLIIHAYAENAMIRRKVESEIKKDFPDISEEEMLLLVNEQVFVRKTTIRKLDGLEITKRKFREKREHIKETRQAE